MKIHYVFVIIVQGNPWDKPEHYEGGLKSFRPNKDTRYSDAPISVTRPNSTRRFSLQNNCSQR